MVSDDAPVVRRRPTSRVVMIDPTSRILMLHLHYPYVIDPANPVGAGGGEPFWALPGGGLQPGETFEQAARREAREETGIVVDTIIAWLWSREKRLLVRGVEVIFEERYGLVWLPQPAAVSFDQLVGDEHEAVLDARWLSMDDLARLDDPVSPPGLANLLRPVLAGSVPPVLQKLPG